MPYSTKGIVVIVTGGASGIGAGVVKSFLQEGAKYIAILDVDEEAGIKLEKELNNKYSDTKTKFMKCDVSNDAQVGEVLKTVKTEAGNIDLVINSAGVFQDKLYNKTININVNGVISVSMKAYELMRKDVGGRGGAIINFSSVAALVNMSACPVYSASKAAVLQFSICLGKDPNYTRSGVRVMTICFGATDTPILSSMTDGAFDKDSFQDLLQFFNSCKLQKVESAVDCVVHAFKEGASASTWLSTDDDAPFELTSGVEEAYGILGKEAMQSSLKILRLNQ